MKTNLRTLIKLAIGSPVAAFLGVKLVKEAKAAEKPPAIDLCVNEIHDMDGQVICRVFTPRI